MDEPSRHDLPTSEPRRWLQFGLPGLFALVTLFAMGLSLIHQDPVFGTSLAALLLIATATLLGSMVAAKLSLAPSGWWKGAIGAFIFTLLGLGVRYLGMFAKVAIPVRPLIIGCGVLGGLLGGVVAWRISRPKRRPGAFTYAMRTVSAVFAVAFVVAIVVRVREVHVRESTVQSIRDLGGGFSHSYRNPWWSSGWMAIEPMHYHDGFLWFSKLVVDLVPHSVDFQERQVTDENVAQLKLLTAIRSVVLRDHRLTGEGWQALNALPDLRILKMKGPLITDEHLKHISTLQKPNYLIFEETSITDAGLKYLADLTNVGELQIHGTKLTPDAVERLERALPNTAIIYVE